MPITLSKDDLVRTTVGRTAPPIWEIMQSVRLLRHPGTPPRLPGWRSRALSRLTPRMAALVDLVPNADTMPDFLMPMRPGTDLESGIDRLLSTPLATVRAELQPFVATGAMPERVRPLYDGDRAAWQRLGGAVREYHATLIAPYSATVAALLEADRAARGHVLAGGGIEQLLNTLDPMLRWDTGTLTYRCAAGDTPDVAMRGRGLILQPSLFAPSASMQVVDDHPGLLFYRITMPDTTPQPSQALVSLLGRTRAAILMASADGASTTQLSRRTGVSPASASQHAAVLRSAGLITTHRTGQTVLHLLTPLGATLLTRAYSNHTPPAQH